MSAYLAGFGTSLSLIVAIGAQNAFVLKQGLLRHHVFATCAFCALSDALLITAGVMGAGAIASSAPWFLEVMRWGGVIFLLVYGALRFKAALAGGEALRPGEGAAASLAKVLTTCLVLTWANPQVYLDTVGLVGSISAQYPGHRLAFGVAAACGSFSFFAALGYGARLLAPVFAKPAAWVVLEIIVGATMWAIAAGLAFGG